MLESEGRWTWLTIPIMTWAAFAIASVAAVINTAGHANDPTWTSVGACALLVVALALAGFGVAYRPRRPLVLFVTGLVFLIGMSGVHSQWDSFRLLTGVATGVTWFAALAISLPRTVQLALVSGMAVFHFCGVFSAITSPPPQSWLSFSAWVVVFRPHLLFCYTNNAYQFYSPEPGPANLLWFCVEYLPRDDVNSFARAAAVVAAASTAEPATAVASLASATATAVEVMAAEPRTASGPKVWFKVPRKPETHLDPMSVQYYRRLSITEAANQNEMPFTDGAWENIWQPRVAYQKIPLMDKDVIPYLAQYRQPQATSRKIIASYARHVCHEHGGPGVVKSVKVYRVLHNMLNVQQFADREDPYAQWTYWPYYLGEFDPDGTLRDPFDPLLYWLIPIVRQQAPVRPGRPATSSVINYLAEHAGRDPFED